MVINSLKSNKCLNQILSKGVLLIPFALYLVPMNWLEKQDAICLFRNTLDLDCIGCGMTRAFLSVLHFQLEEAYNFNKLVIIVFPLLSYLWIKKTIRIYSNNL